MQRPDHREHIVQAGADLIRRLDDLLERIDRELAIQTNTIALLRQSVNSIIYAGMVMPGASSLTWSQDFAVPFASVGVADPNGAGPLTVATEGAEGVASIGAAQLNSGDVVCLPLTGRSLKIVATAQHPIFVALYLRTQPLYWGKT